MKKNDEDKVRMDLLPFDTLEEVAKVLQFGAEKYSDNGWKYVPDAMKRYEAALLRHFVQHKKGKISDEESNLFHLSHIACNALFLLWHFMNPEWVRNEENIQNGCDISWEYVGKRPTSLEEMKEYVSFKPGDLYYYLESGNILSKTIHVEQVFVERKLKIEGEEYLPFLCNKYTNVIVFENYKDAVRYRELMKKRGKELLDAADFIQ